jgi:phage regulator Rha-like protein
MENLELKVVGNKEQVVTSSLQVAETFGKRHTHVIDVIENKINSAEN